MSKPQMNSFQPSLTEWFVNIGKVTDSVMLREEDNSRTDRFNILYKIFGFPGDRPDVFEAIELYNRSDRFNTLLSERGQQLAAIRLVPKVDGLPKLRHRGPPLLVCYEDWFLKQPIDYNKYIAEIYHHIEPKAWSASFVIDQSGVYGEIVAGTHTQLTHGETTSPTIQFNFDYNSWQWSENNEEAVAALNKMLAHTLVDNIEKRYRVTEKLGVDFLNNYLFGYFESFVGGNGQIMFVDYNRVLPKYIVANTILNSTADSKSALKGAVAFPGIVRGLVRIVDIEKYDDTNFVEGDILVTDNTDVRYLPLMKKAGAIVTNRGGILSHAAIVARELKKPCLIGTGRATEMFKDGDHVEVNATLGTVKKLV